MNAEKSAEAIVLFEDDCALTLEPLSLTRPVWELRCGLLTLEQKIRAFFPEVRAYYWPRSYLAPATGNLPPCAPRGSSSLLWINGCLLPGSGFSAIGDLREGFAWVQDGHILAFRGQLPRNWEAGTQLPESGFHKMEAPSDAGRLCRYPWDLVQAMNAENAREARQLRPLGEVKGDVHQSAILLSIGEIFICENCRVNPGVVIDASQGPVVLDEHVSVGANAVIQGPTYLGPFVQVKPLTNIIGSCLGEQARVGGEVSCSIIQGYSNKQHTGFLGHSYIGAWCNLGSGTETSNLKNNYSPVKVQVGEELIDTNQLFVGLTMGDHSKTAIGTVFNTGTVVGVGCNIFGAGFPPRYIPSFHWGGADKLVLYPLKSTLDIARKVMARRDRKLGQVEAQILRWIYENRAVR